ncbi:hypothetical protein P879_02697 [Paragonimus westermani]|uniref:FERM, RhoGEF and pleckstrin domain-containing protein 2 n=1 Tax=Paragonimus westermani TaxID=34504 RepID=A0A8T0DI67_9TREM|nr:hypothetical protein P879_02697 [Paragonimus westermani]
MVQKSEEKCSSSVTRDAPMDVSVISLDDNMELFQVKGSCIGRELFQLVVQKMGLFDYQYFDLAYLDVEGNHCWLDHSKLLMKIAKSLNQTTLEFVFSVKYYIPHPHLLVNDHTRYLFALQIKRDFFRGLLHSNRNTSLLLAAFIVQSELGDYVETECKSYAYLRRHHLLRSAPDSYLMRVMELHQTLAGLTKADADFRLLDAARKVELYGVRLHPVKDSVDQPCNLGVTYMGIVVFTNFTRVNGFSWNKIRKLSFKRRKFFIKPHSDEEGYIKDTVEFSFLSQAACKNFWKKCIEQHSFFRSSTQIWNDTADRQRSQLPFSVNRTGSFPSLKRLRRSVSFEGNVASHSSVCQTPKHDDSDTMISSGHASQVSTPLRRLARLRHRALSLKIAKSTPNRQSDYLSDSHSSHSSTLKSSWALPDNPYPTRKGSVPSRPPGVTRLLSHSSTATAEHFQLLRLSFTSLLPPSPNDTGLSTPTFSRKYNWDLSRNGRAASTPSISQADHVRRKPTSHSFVPRQIAPNPQWSTTPRAKQPIICNSGTNLSDDMTFPDRPHLNEQDNIDTDVFSRKSLSQNGVNPVHHRSTLCRTQSSSCSLDSEDKPIPISLNGMTNFVHQLTSPREQTHERSLFSDESLDDDACVLSLGRLGQPRPFPLSMFTAISSPQLTGKPESAELLDRHSMHGGLSTESVVNSAVDLFDCTRAVIQELPGVDQGKEMVSIFNTFVHKNSHEKPFNLITEDSETHKDESNFTASQEIPTTILRDSTKPAGPIVADSSISSKPEDSTQSRHLSGDAHVIEADRLLNTDFACSLVSSTLLDSVKILEAEMDTERPAQTSAINGPKDDNSESHLLTLDTHPLELDMNVDTFGAELSSTGSRLTSEPSAHGDIPESLADAISLGAISMLTGVSCYGQDQKNDSIVSDSSQCPVASRSPDRVGYSIKSCISLKQLGRGYWGPSESSSEDSSVQYKFSRARLVSRAKSESSVLKRRLSVLMKATADNDQICKRRQSPKNHSRKKIRSQTVARSRNTLLTKGRTNTAKISLKPDRCVQMFNSVLEAERLFQRDLKFLQTFLPATSSARQCDALLHWLKNSLYPLLEPLMDRHSLFVCTLEQSLDPISPNSSTRRKRKSVELNPSDFDHDDLLSALSDENLNTKNNDSSSSTESIQYTSPNSTVYSAFQTDLHSTEIPNEFGQQRILRLGHCFIQHLDIIKLYSAWITSCPELIANLWLLGHCDLADGSYDFIVEVENKVSPVGNTTCVSRSDVADVPDKIPVRSATKNSLSDAPLVRQVWHEVECSPQCTATLLTYLLRPGRHLRQYCIQLGGLLAQYPSDHPDLEATKDAFGQFVQAARVLYPVYQQAERLANVLQLARSIIPMDSFLNLPMKSDLNAVSLYTTKSQCDTEICGSGPVLSHLLQMPNFHRLGWLKKYSKRGFQPRMVFLFGDRILYASRIRGISGLCFKLHGVIFLRDALVEKVDSLPFSPKHFAHESKLHQSSPTPFSLSGNCSSCSTIKSTFFALSVRSFITQQPNEASSTLDETCMHPNLQSGKRSRSRSRTGNCRRKVVFSAPTQNVRDAWCDDLSVVIENHSCKTPSGIFRFREVVNVEGILRTQLIHDQCRNCDRTNHPNNTCANACDAEVALPQCYQNSLLSVCWRRRLTLTHTQLLNANDCQLHGYLLRKCQFGSGWQKLWTVFSDFRLLFYKSPSDVQPRGSLSLPGYTVRLSCTSKSPQGGAKISRDRLSSIHSKEKCLELAYNSKRYRFRPESDEALMCWFHALSTVLVHMQSAEVKVSNSSTDVQQPADATIPTCESTELVYACFSPCHRELSGGYEGNNH